MLSINSPTQKDRRVSFFGSGKATILAWGWLAVFLLPILIFFWRPLSAHGQRSHRELLRQVASQGTRFERERQHYTYRQEFSFWELNRRGAPAGSYHEVRDILFDAQGGRTEEFVDKPRRRLKTIRLTDEDFEDLRNVQPFVLTEDTLWLYEFKYKGIEQLRGRPTFVYRIQPRQVLEGQRMLDGWVWIDQEHEQIIQVSGEPLPQIHGKEQNLFPDFTTVYEAVDGELWFPVETQADDWLPFSSGVRRVRYQVLYSQYRRFTVESEVDFEPGRE